MSMNPASKTMANSGGNMIKENYRLKISRRSETF